MSGINREQRAFEAQLPGLLKDHAGEFVVFHDERPIAFYGDLSEAYRSALAKFGPDEEFLVEQIAIPSTDIASLTWEVGAIGLQ